MEETKVLYELFVDGKYFDSYDYPGEAEAAAKTAKRLGRAVRLTQLVVDNVGTVCATTRFYI